MHRLIRYQYDTEPNKQNGQQKKDGPGDRAKQWNGQ